MWLCMITEWWVKAQKQKYLKVYVVQVRPNSLYLQSKNPWQYFIKPLYYHEPNVGTYVYVKKYLLINLKLTID